MILPVKSLSLTRTQTSSPRVSFLSTIPLCATRTPPLTQRCLALLRYEKLRLFLLNISFSHTDTNSVSQGLISLHHSLVCRSHTLSLPRDISRSLICLSSYHSRCEISFSLADTKLRLSGSHFSLIFFCTSKMPVHCTEHQDAFFYKTPVVIDPCRS